MVQVDSALSTGIPELDGLLKGLIPGDNIVWQVDSIEDYAAFVRPFAKQAVRKGRSLIYFRYGQHEPLLPAGDGVEIVEVDPTAGFESFLRGIRKKIEEVGRGGFYVFDSVSDLAPHLHSDSMVGNFFMLTCPMLFHLETIAYFGILRNFHSFHALNPIRHTTQLFLDLFGHEGRLYVQPLKVQQRHSSTMYMLHEWRRGEFVPVTESYAVAKILNSGDHSVVLDSASSRLGPWTRTIVYAEEILEEIERGESPPERGDGIFERMLPMSISQDSRVLELAKKYLTLKDLVRIWKRMIGTGLIGGKAAGMLLARAILEKSNPELSSKLEPLDSFYIPSHVFYTFMVRNGCWWDRSKETDPESYLRNAETARQGILTGDFPEHIVKQFANMLDYFGQSPFIVRSSSLLEDNFGNSFAGMYESIFCANQGSRDQRLENFISAVKTIYTSVLSEKALTYRHRRKILDRDEQMALLVQRVSGSLCGELYYPQIAGVGFSYNPYVWSEKIDPEAGLLRLVFGMGTRAVDRVEDDYTRIVALNAPERRPEVSSNDVRQYAQQKVDVLDLEANQLVSVDFEDVVEKAPQLPLEIFATRDMNLERQARERGLKDIFSWVLTFDKLFKETDFIEDMRSILTILQKAYDHPVDIEFTGNFVDNRNYIINVVQCRPLQVKGIEAVVNLPEVKSEEDVLLRSGGPVIGLSRAVAVDRIIYVDPQKYNALPVYERYAIARLVGKINHSENGKNAGTVMLLGPGRWGTTTPSLGVPVSFAEIDNVSILGEIVAPSDNVTPDVSLGTHFFSELVETEMLYLAIFPNRKKSRINTVLLDSLPNRMTEILPNQTRYLDTVKVFDASDFADGKRLKLYADTLKQGVICRLESR